MGAYFFLNSGANRHTTILPEKQSSPFPYSGRIFTSLIDIFCSVLPKQAGFALCTTLL